MKKVLITGASGFVGRNCVPLLVAKGYEVHATTHQRLLKQVSPGICWHEADLLSPGIVANLVHRIQPDALLHLAWYAVPGKFWEARENLDWVRASQELLSAFTENGGKRLVAAGSCAEYDSTAGECVENMTPLLPATLYGKSKHAVEEFIQSSTRKSGPSFAWGRIFFMYGPNEPPTRVVAYVIRCLLQEEPALCSKGTQNLDFLHVEDVASAFIALLESEVQGPVNIGSGEANPLRVVLEEIGRQMQRSELIQFGAHQPEAQPVSYWAKTQRLTKEVGWTPQYNLTSGLAQTINWWRNSGLTSAPIQRKR
jgi:nucleoside-diphosphate-sugar epimerase